MKPRRADPVRLARERLLKAAVAYEASSGIYQTQRMAINLRYMAIMYAHAVAKPKRRRR